MQTVTLAGLVKISLPTRDVLLCDGGYVRWGDEEYLSLDPVFGTIGVLEALTEGTGDELPAGKITFLPPELAAAIDLSRPGFQGSRVQMWIAEIDEATGAPIGEPDTMADWQSDRTILRRGGEVPRSLEMVCVSRSQRLLVRNDGNAMSTSGHQRLFPGERGHDNALGMEIEVAWGVASPPRGVQAA
ncbi:hypothetical protein [Sphingomonas sp. Leaf4]|uniref:hypothetical protein n=1 Tax=Sphingomonas sp. Leaf4 TaxID=2876553 RepID=UPI001E4E803F|nr:hypothetical protein [Sphingomonas sp. Leaf4]